MGGMVRLTLVCVEQKSDRVGGSLEGVFKLARPALEEAEVMPSLREIGLVTGNVGVGMAKPVLDVAGSLVAFYSLQRLPNVALKVAQVVPSVRQVCLVLRNLGVGLAKSQPDVAGSLETP